MHLALSQLEFSGCIRELLHAAVVAHDALFEHAVEDGPHAEDGPHKERDQI